MRKVSLIEVLRNESEYKPYFVSTDEIKEMYYLGDNDLIVSGLPGGIDLTELNKQIGLEIGEMKSNHLEEPDVFDEFDEHSPYEVQFLFSKTLGYDDVTVTGAPEFIEKEKGDTIIFNPENMELSFASSYTEARYYSFHDGQRFHEVAQTFYDDVSITDLLISDDYVNLDEWDGRNFKTGSTFEHEKIYKVLEVDGTEAEPGTYLLVHTSQWQGTHPTAELITLSELESHLEELDRDLNEYITAIKAI